MANLMGGNAYSLECPYCKGAVLQDWVARPASAQAPRPCQDPEPDHLAGLERFDVVQLSGYVEPDDEARGIFTFPVALRWNGARLDSQELRDKAKSAVEVVDARYNKDVMDVKILRIDMEQQYVQLVVRANFSPPPAHMEEVKQMALDLKRHFDPSDDLRAL